MTAPDFNEVLVDGTVFYAESNGMFFFSRNEKVTALQSYFFLSICEEIKTFVFCRWI